MLMLYMRRVNLDEIPDNLEQIVSDLDEAFRPVLSPAIEAQAAAIKGVGGIHSASADVEWPGRVAHFSELLATSAGLIGIQLIEDRQRSYLLQGGGSSSEQTERQLFLFAVGTQDIVEPFNQVAEFLEEQLSVTIAPFRYVSNRFKELKAEGMVPPDAPSADEVAVANLLTDPIARRAALAIASSGGLLVRDLPKQLPADQQSRTSDLIQDLEATGVVQSDLVIVCAKTSEQVLRVPTQEALDQAAAAGVKCACGAEIKDESTELALSLTTLGRRMLDGSWWMTVVLMEELARLGIERDSMLVEQNDGGDEVDCFADVNGDLAIFELKDKEFSLGNAYSFGSKFGIYRPAHSVVVTTSQVGNDAKEHFKKALSAQRADRYTGSGENTTSIEYIEGLANLTTGLEELVGGVYMSDAERLLRNILPGATLDSKAVIEAIGSQGGSDAGASEVADGDEAPARNGSEDGDAGESENQLAQSETA